MAAIGALLAASFTAARAADERLPLFLAPAVVDDEPTPEMAAAVKRRQHERAVAVSNPNLKWKPYRPVASQHAAPASATTSADKLVVVEKENAQETAKETAKATGKAASQKSLLRIADGRAGKRPAVSQVAVTQLASEDPDKPAKRKPQRSNLSRFRSQIMQVTAIDEKDPFADEPIPGFDDKRDTTDFNDDETMSDDDAPSTRPTPSRRRPLDRTETERRPTPRAEEPYSSEEMPAPSDNYDNSIEPPQSFVPLPTHQAPTVASCVEDKRECITAMTNLKSGGIARIDVNIAVNGLEGTDFPCECVLTGKFGGRDWGCSTFTWKASSLCHKPLYFEEVQLERYGHSLNPLIQPLFSGLDFFIRIPVLPYMMGVYPPNECQYVLGYYRPGNCAPYLVPPLPISLRGFVVEAVSVGAIIAILP